MKNPWLRSLPASERERTVFRVAGVVSLIFCHSPKQLSDDASWLIARLNFDLLNKLEIWQSDFIMLWGGLPSNYPLVFLVLKKVMAGMDFEEAEGLARQEIEKAREEEEKRMARRRAFWLKITGPFVKARLYAATLHHLWVRFNKFCPRNLQSDILIMR